MLIHISPNKCWWLWFYVVIQYHLHPSESNQCSSNWAEYNGNCYYAETTKKTWLAAETWCQENGGKYLDVWVTNFGYILNVGESSVILEVLEYYIHVRYFTNGVQQHPACYFLFLVVPLIYVQFFTFVSCMHVAPFYSITLHLCNLCI